MLLPSKSSSWLVPLTIATLMSHASSANLFAGEIIDSIAGAPTLYRYTTADNSQDGITKPLMVFIPGGVHTARIAYGGHENSRKEDFLAHWANQQGFNFLAVSYPVETEPENVLPPSNPLFRVGDWGNQVAQVANKVIEENGLGKDVLLVSWSMGGRVVVPFTKSATKLGLRVRMYAAIAATPGLRGLSAGSPGRDSITLSANGYALGPHLYPLFTRQLRDQNEDNGNRTIIPEDIFKTQYWGNTPVGLLGWEVIPIQPSQSGGNWSLIDDNGQHFNDSQAFDFTSYPWVATLYPNDQQDFRHAFTDAQAWGFLFGTKLSNLVGNIRAGGQFNGTIPESTWNEILPQIRAIPGKLSSEMDGNHFFFVGERGAKRTAAHIARHWEACEEMRSDLAETLGISGEDLM